MPALIRSAVAAIAAGSFALSLALAPGSGALAEQAKPKPAAKQPAPAAQAPAEAPQLKQIALTDKQIEQLLAAQPEIDALAAKLPQKPDAKPDPKIDAQFEEVAKKHGFASFGDYTDVVDNVGLVLAGFDPQTKSYVGPDAVLKSQIAAVQADKKMPAKDKKAALADLNAALKSPAPQIENKGNIDLVTKSYDKLTAVLQQAD
ncbi:hypothetical protein HNR60_004828 [Rhodopseudomonas rhenobacensis]|uniref:Uncharacterized protein n=1 Tax=Rhodopseudomonas rhenobacensis TaxID=87461 RepID=A0A7W7Z912_9BRAD|nr:hypothetical protein [Rhodopseudomonas rhenobacensis]MBB5050040.1 hypothetical protein [Rhodopseudomonas rhenobacensis]